MNETALVIMAKEPITGKTKTRLCPPLTPEQAASLYEAFLFDTIALGSKLKNIDLLIAVTPPESTSYFHQLELPETHLLPVSCPDIGDCLAQVITSTIEMGYIKALALNSDGPSLPSEYIGLAVDLLEDNDLVLGPGDDGGYYLVGLKEPYIDLFYGINWSTSRVFNQTLSKASILGLRVGQTPPWYDIDTINEVQRLYEELDRLPGDQLIHTRSYFLNSGISIQNSSE